MLVFTPIAAADSVFDVHGNTNTSLEAKQAYDVLCHYCSITVSLAAFIAADMLLCWVNEKLLIQVATDQLDHK